MKTKAQKSILINLPMLAGGVKLKNITKSVKPKPTGIRGQRVRRAYTLLEQGKRSQAEKLLTKKLEENPDSGYTVFHMIRFYSKAKDFKSAHRMFEHARERKLDNEKIISLMCETYSRFGLIKEALELYSEAIQRSILNVKAVNALLRYFEKNVNLAKAKEIYETALHCKIADKHTYSLMIIIYKNAKMWEEAQDVFKAAVEADLADRYAVSQLLNTLKKFDRWDEVKEVYGIALRKGIVDAHIHTMMIDIHIKIGELSEAQEILSTVFEDDIPIHAYSSMIYGCLDADNMQRAKDYFDDASKKGLADVQLFTLMVRGFGLRWSPFIARSYFDKALEKGIYDSDLFAVMIRVYKKDLQIKKAMEVLRLAVEKEAVGPMLFYQAIKAFSSRAGKRFVHETLDHSARLGRIDVISIQKLINKLYEDRWFGDIIELIERLPESIKQETSIRLKLADAQRKRGLDKEAIATVEELVSRKDVGEKTRFDALVIKAFALKDCGRKEEAFRLLLNLNKLGRGDNRKHIRLACGLVFCWAELGFDARLKIHDIEKLRKKLEYSRDRHYSNLKVDIENALREIEKSAVFEQGIWESDNS
jgi:pentatricopeptide repeat protein